MATAFKAVDAIVLKHFLCFCLPEIGIGLVGFGLFFLLFGVLLYFDSVLLAFGNASSIFIPYSLS